MKLSKSIRGRCKMRALGKNAKGKKGKKEGWRRKRRRQGLKNRFPAKTREEAAS
ncbi:MAG: hypothetical protein N2315_06605 [Thermanaerothrix sp.]|nr:hypothetical protein [Thermanaerothrix sp.]